jgi:membrane protease YdiL (CAAX protease family)
MSIFLNDNNQLRSGWKFAAYLAFLLILWFASGLLVAGRPADVLENQLLIIALNFVTAIAAMWLSIKFIDHRPFGTFGVGFFPRWRSGFLFGLALSAGMLAVLIGGCYALGYVSMRWTGRQVPPSVLIGYFSLLLLAAANEELVFRGFPLQILIEGIGEWPAIIVMSVLFGLLHWFNPNTTLLGLVNTAVAGILLSLAYVKTRSLWMPYGIHLGWNLGLGFVFGFPLSGVDIASLWTTGTAGSETILGGDYGPEGGLLATFIFATAAVIVNRHGSIDSSKADAGSNTGQHSRDRAADS